MAAVARQVAAPAPAPRPRRTAVEEVSPAPAPARMRARRPRIGRSVVWVSVIGTLLAGIVALNVAALQLRIERGKVTADIAKIRAENDSLRAELSSARAPGRVEASALADYGLVEAGNLTYVKLPPPGR